MPSILITPPASEPVTLDEARAFLRVEHYDDDDLIAALVTGARIHVEARTRRALMSQTWRLALDAWPSGGRLAVAPGPLMNVSAARVYDEAGVAHPVDTQAFVIDRSTDTVAFAAWSLPAPGRARAGIEIDTVCGYGDTAADVPEPLREAVRQLVAHAYENRGDGGAPPPAAAAALIAPYRVMSL